jgi:hypothetical protein
LRHPRELHDEVATESAAYTAVLHLHDLLLALGGVELGDLGTVDVDFGHVVDDESDVEVVVVAVEDVFEEGGLAAALWW